MKKNSYSDSGFLNNYGARYTTQNWYRVYLSEIMNKMFKRVSGTILGIFCVSASGTVENGKTLFKMGDTEFAHNIDLNQTIKHGAILYIVIALLVVPVGICSTQHHTFEFVPPLILRAPSSADLFEEFESPTFSVTAAAINREIEQFEIEQALAAAPPFYLHIMKAAQTYEVDVPLIRAIIMAESSNNPKAVSHRGAQGLMQLMPTTARWLGVRDAFNPELNIDGGVRYLKSLLNRFGGDVRLALAAYNAGSRYVYKYGGVPPFKATRVYIKKVLQYRKEYQNEKAIDLAGLTAI